MPRLAQMSRRSWEMRKKPTRGATSLQNDGQARLPFVPYMSSRGGVGLQIAESTRVAVVRHGERRVGGTVRLGLTLYKMLCAKATSGEADDCFPPPRVDPRVQRSVEASPIDGLCMGAWGGPKHPQATDHLPT